MKWPPKKVLVHWTDSMVYHAWSTVDDRIKQLTSKDVMEHQSVGFLVDETDDYIAVCTSVGFESHVVDETTQIPKKAISKIRKLK